MLPANGGYHILRHTFCSHLAMQGATAKAIQELAGHQDLTTTQRYMHLSPAHKDAAIRLLDRRPTDGEWTFADHVAPILAKHCQVCHKPNTAAPFSLLTYEDAKAKARTIAEVVSEGRMPPWFAPPRDGDRIQHHSLSAEERDTVVQWVKSGMTRGDDSRLPKPPDDKPTKWRIGEPDLILTATPFTLPTEGDIAYKYVILPHVFAADTWVTGVQILPDVPRSHSITSAGNFGLLPLHPPRVSADPTVSAFPAPRRHLGRPPATARD